MKMTSVWHFIKNNLLHSLFVLIFLKLCVWAFLIFQRSPKTLARIDLPDQSRVVVPWTQQIEHLRQSHIECSSYALQSVFGLLDTTLPDQSAIWEDIWPKFSIGVVPRSVSRYAQNYVDVKRLPTIWVQSYDMESLYQSLALWRPVILLVLHQWVEHYFTVIWTDVDLDEWYIYDSLAPRKDESMTEDLNGDAPWNYTLSSNELYEKRSSSGRGLFDEWGVSLGEKE